MPEINTSCSKCNLHEKNLKVLDGSRVLTPSNILLFPYIELKTSTIGYPSCHTEVKIIDENGQVVPVGVPGELCIRGYANMLGYWNDQEKTEELISKDRWLHSG